MRGSIYSFIVAFIFRFTSILGDKRYSTEEVNESSTRKSIRLSSPPAESNTTYPNLCQLCGKFRVQHNKKRFTPYTITTFNAESAIKFSAKSKNESLYREIENLDLIAKEFKVHEPCYKNLTLEYYSNQKKEAETSASVSMENETSACYSKSNYEEVKEFVNDVIIQEKKPASMKLLHEIYGLGIGNTSYRHKLKTRLQNDFGETICFLSQKNKTLPEIVISAEYFTADTVFHSNEQTIKHAAKILRKDIFKKFDSFSMENWPPDPQELDTPELEPPQSIQCFVKSLLKPAGDRTPNINRIVDCLTQDIVFNVLHRKVPLKKQILLGLGLHSLTGSRKIIDILFKFGHCVSYDYVCDVETAYAEVAQEKAKQGFTLPLQPIFPFIPVFSHFWVDNFDVLVDKQCGGGSINTTHMVAFQYPNENAEIRSINLSVPRKKSRQLFIEDINVQTIPVNKKKEPPTTFAITAEITPREVNFNSAYLMWIYLRKIYSMNQTIPTFKGFKLQHRKTKLQPFYKTIETYLTPLNSKVTEYQTIQRYMQYLQSLAEQVNMPLVNITLDVGAAINAYLVVWNNPVMFKNIIIHLGSFHFLKENFQVYRLHSLSAKNLRLKIFRTNIF